MHVLITALVQNADKSVECAPRSTLLCVPALIAFSKGMQAPLDPGRYGCSCVSLLLMAFTPTGLYLGVFDLAATVATVHVRVCSASPHVVPCVKLRHNPHVSRVEWEHLVGLASAPSLHAGPGLELQELIALSLRMP